MTDPINNWVSSIQFFKGDKIAAYIEVKGWRKWLRILQRKPVKYVQWFEVKDTNNG